jgi:hypothetical protein
MAERVPFHTALLIEPIDNDRTACGNIDHCKTRATWQIRRVRLAQRTAHLKDGTGTYFRCDDHVVPILTTLREQDNRLRAEQIS